MKKKIQILILFFFVIFHHASNAQERTGQKIYRTKEFGELNSRLCKGWNTWHTRSVLCHVLLPESVAINLKLINHQSGDTLKTATIGREDFDLKEHVIPGPRSYDGFYTSKI